MMAEGITPVMDVTGNKGNEGVGGGWGIWILIILFFIMFAGGNGFGGNKDNGGSAVDGAVLGALSAQTGANGLSNDFIYTNLNSELQGLGAQSLSNFNAISQGICNSSYEALNNAKDTQFQIMNSASNTQAAINNGFNTTNLSMLNGFNQSNITSLQSTNAIQSQLAECCCGMKQELMQNRYEAEKNTAATIAAVQAEGAATRALITENTIQDLRDRLQASELGYSQAVQTANIVSQVRPFPNPAYVTCSPYSSPCNTCC